MNTMEYNTRTCSHLLCLGVLILAINVLNVNATTGNSSVDVNVDGTITYAALPAGEGYSTPATFDEGSFPLPTTWDFIGSFLKTVSPGSPPYGKCDSNC